MSPSPLLSSCWFLFLLLGSARPARPGTPPGTRRSTRPPPIPGCAFPVCQSHEAFEAFGGVKCGRSAVLRGDLTQSCTG